MLVALLNITNSNAQSLQLKGGLNYATVTGVNNSDADNQILPKANAGVRIRKKAQFVFSVYSESYNTGGKKFSGQMMTMFTF